MMSVRTLALGFVSSLCVVMGALAPTTAQALTNPERVYEMVSPPYKAGYGVGGITAVAPEGEGVAFLSFGMFAGAPNGTLGSGYLARRGATDWSTVSLAQPATKATFFEGGDYSVTLAMEGVITKPGPNDGASFSTDQAEFLLHSTDTSNTAENWEAAGGIVMESLNKQPAVPTEAGVSSDLCHVLLFEGGGAPLLQEAVSAEQQLYDLARGCDGEPPSLRLVGVKNKPGSHEEPEVINRSCPVTLGIGSQAAGGGEFANAFNAIAAGGRAIFFTTCVGDSDRQLFVRLDGSRTLEVSRPLGACVGEEAPHVPGEVPCQGATTRASAEFRGASEDGSKVFFTTEESLRPEDKDSPKKKDLYMATIGCPEAEPGCEVAKREVTGLVQVSHDPNAAEAAEVQDVVRVAPDGSRVYFVGRGDLLSQGEREALESERRSVPQAGADNLYVYDSVSGQTTFIADLCSGPQLSGTSEDVSCPADLEVAGQGTERNDTRVWPEGEAQIAGKDGRFLVFSTYARLVKSDTDNAKDVYRYDAQTGALVRVSVGEAGYDANGNRDDEQASGKVKNNADATIALGGTSSTVRFTTNLRAINEDGSRIVFSTAEPLSPAAINGLEDVYEWHEGNVSLISTGSAEEPDKQPVISLSGRDVFFVTTAGIAPQDTDGVNDVYDARLGGGFPVAAAPRQPCSGDACQGPLTNPAPLLVPGSVSQASGENLPPPKKATSKRKPKRKVKPKCKRGYARDKKGRCVKVKKKARKAAAHRRGHGSIRGGRS